MNEWEFTGEAASWINESLQRNPALPFSRAKTEQRGQGSLKRRDLTILDKDRNPVLTGEVKLPYARDGGTPYNDTVVSDARSKARRAGCRFFFTWNVNEFVLWEIASDKVSFQDQKYKSWQVTEVHKESRLDIAPTRQEVQSWIDRFLFEFSDIVRGNAPIAIRPPDERFIEILESALRMPIILTFEQLLSLYQTPQFKRDLDKWMREEGWTILDDPEGIKDNLERAAKFACYALVIKLVFHEALLKRYGTRLDSLAVPEHLDTGEQLRMTLEKYFAEAKDITGDYETVFGEDHMAIENRVPFYSDGTVVHWRGLINQIHKFNFSKLDYEIIGQMFERLIAPEERRKYGQFYTRVEVVDLIESFCIRTGMETVMDPACGGGTFLVRAYARKRELSPSRGHGQLLTDLFGVDTSHFATHLTTINLATRDLIDKENYPQIARSDFFDIAAHKTFLSLPKRVETKSLGKSHRAVVVPPLDAVVGNPPYVKQRDIPQGKTSTKGKLIPGTERYYRELARNESGIEFSGRSDIHLYFWPHSTSFLKPEGYLCLLTSSQWLDAEYGFRLQEWILNNFRILALFESIDEPWFVGARVATTITCLQRESDENMRMSNTARFVQLRRPVAEILAHDGSTAGAITTVDRFRDEILGLSENTVNERYRARLMRQEDLWRQGVELGTIMRQSTELTTDDDVDEDKNQATSEFSAQPGNYYGGKWGIYVRAPDLWFQLLDNYRQRFAPLDRIAEIRRGVTSGKDVFFFPVDCSKECLEVDKNPDDFAKHYGLPRKAVESGTVKLVRCGEGRGEVKPIESSYLEPEVHSLMEVDGFTVAPEDCSRLILLVSQPKTDLKGTYVLKYINWGESKGFHKGSTCAARATEEHGWYDVTGHNRGALFWPQAQQYKHAVPANEYRLICNHNLFDVSAVGYSNAVLAGVLNSTWVALSKYQYGRPVGVEGNFKTEVIDTKMMLVPDPTKAKPESQQRVAAASHKMKQRKALMFLSERRLRQMAFTKSGKQMDLSNLSDTTELDMPDRRELDDAVLEMIGVDLPQRRQELIDELYAYLKDFFETTRQKEEKAITNKNTSRRLERIRPADIAAQILKHISENEPDLLRQYDSHFFDKFQPFDTYDLPAEGEASPYSDMLVTQAVKFTKGVKTQVALIPTLTGSQAQLITLLANTGTRGLVRVPHNDTDCCRTLDEYREFTGRRDERIKELIQERTSDDDTQEKILVELMSPINH